MKTPTSQEIAERAYSVWEQRGHPQDYDSSVNCWLTAEHELAEQAEADAEPALDLESGPDVSNLERALPPAERSRARSERRAKNQTTEESSSSSSTEVPTPETGSEHYIVAADRARLRIYQENSSGERSGSPLTIASSFDIPEGKKHYTNRDTDQAGRFPGSRGKGAALGGSTDERLPMLEEQQRRAASELGARVNEFFQQHPRATWDFAAGPVVHRALLDVLDPDVRERLGEALLKELVNQPLPELRGHFTVSHTSPAGR